MKLKVLITGGSGGIGREMVRLFAKKGHSVAFTYCRNKKEAQSLSDECGAVAFSADFSREESVWDLADRIKREFGEIDVLINNAGVSHYGLFQNTTEEDFHRVFSVDFQSVYFLTKAFILPMIQKRSGCIINISSIWGQTGASCEVLYSSAKAAVIGFTKALAKELAPSLVRVNCIAPGVVDTDMLSGFSSSEKDALKTEIPTERFTDPLEIAETALFLAENDMPSLTGQVLGVNGAMYC